MPRLKVVQTLTAGVDHIRSEVPDGVLLCNGRGIHNASTAELALTLTLASLRGVPGFVRDQDAEQWHQGWRASLADKTVLVVGYGDIGRDIEARLLPFEVDVLRVARTARDGVHAMADLPDLLPRADVVVLIVPGTTETRGLVDAEFLSRMREARCSSTSRGSGRGHRRPGRRAAVRAGAGGPRRHRPRAAPAGSSALVGAATCSSRPTSAAPPRRCGRGPTGWCAGSWSGSPPGEPVENVMTGEY